MPSSSSSSSHVRYRGSPKHSPKRSHSSSGRHSSPKHERRRRRASSSTTPEARGTKHHRPHRSDAKKESKCATIKKLTRQVQDAKLTELARYEFMAELAQSKPCKQIIDSHARSKTSPFYDLAAYVLDLHYSQTLQQQQSAQQQSAPRSHFSRLPSTRMGPDMVPYRIPVVESSRFAADGTQRGFLGRMWYKGKRMVKNNLGKLMVAAILAAVATFGPGFLVPFGFVVVKAAGAAASLAMTAAGAAASLGMTAAQWLAVNPSLWPIIYATVRRMMPASAEVTAANAEIERQSRKPGLVGGGKTSTIKEAADPSKKSTHPMVLRSRQYSF